MKSKRNPAVAMELLRADYNKKLKENTKLAFEAAMTSTRMLCLMFKLHLNAENFSDVYQVISDTREYTSLSSIYEYASKYAKENNLKVLSKEELLSIDKKLADIVW